MHFNRISPCVALFSLAFYGLAAVGAATAAADQQKKDISSRVIKTTANERVLIQEVWIDAPVAKVWNAYVTDEGWTGWASPVAKVDLRVGGTIRTHYTPDARIGDPGTNVLHIINYVPERVLTLQAELQANWPEILKEDAENLMNIVVFEPVGKKRTRILSYGVGYRNTPAYENLLKFFIPANERLYRKLKAYLEGGRRADFKHP